VKLNVNATVLLWFIAAALCIVLILLVIRNTRNRRLNTQLLGTVRGYIRKEMSNGMSRDAIAEKLREKGWRDDVIHYETLAAEKELEKRHSSSIIT
jgi:hypothetical protein